MDRPLRNCRQVYFADLKTFKFAGELHRGPTVNSGLDFIFGLTKNCFQATSNFLQK